jgi:hypothetical protein
MKLVRRTTLVVVLLIVGLALFGCAPQPPSQSSAGSPKQAQVSTTPPTAPPTEAAPSGILAFRLDEDPGAPPSVVLTLIDPETGSSRTWRKFESAGKARIDMMTGSYSAYYQFAYLVRRMFSPDYSRVAAAEVLPDGSQHVGWIDAAGAYVDVSAAIMPAKSDFSDLPAHRNPRFGADGMFYFLDIDSWEVKKVDPSDLRPGAVKTVQKLSADKGIYGDKGGFELYDSGKFWMSQGDSGRAPEDPSAKPIDLKNLLPTSKRSGWNPVASPDGKHVAFLSVQPNSSDPTAEFFTVSRTGGTPVRVATDYAFDLSQPPVQLIDWF